MSSDRPAAVPSTSVLVGVDGSERAIAAVGWAAAEADRRACGLQIVHCRPEPGDDAVPSHGGDAELVLRAGLDAARSAAPAVAVATALVTGDPLTRLLDLSRHSVLMVVGAPGRVSVSSSAGGSTAAGLATYGHCPLVVARRAAPLERPVGSPPVVVGTDGSRTSDAAMVFAFEAAAARQAELEVVMAWTGVGFDAAGPGFRVGADVSEAAAAADRALTAQVSAVARRYPPVRVRQLLVQDRPVRALIKRAAGSPLLVVGSHGGGGVIGMAVGSTSRTLLYESPCPIAIVRSWYA